VGFNEHIVLGLLGETRTEWEFSYDGNFDNFPAISFESFENMTKLFHCPFVFEYVEFLVTLVCTGVSTITNEVKTFETVSSVVFILLPFEEQKMRKLSFFLLFLVLLTIVIKVQSAECEKYELTYYDDFLNFLDTFDEKDKIVNFYFYGQKNETVGDDGTDDELRLILCLRVYLTREL
jgi:hypothetical protein